MSELERRLQSLRPSRMLDLATGRGGGAAWLQSLFDCPGIPVVCVDITDRGFRSGAEALSTPRVLPLLSKAGSIAVRSGSVGLVSVINSLHHFPRPEAAVAEMRRIAGPGSAVLIAEMHRGVRTEAQRTHMLIHHWWAAADRLMGLSHAETFTDIELRRLAEGLGASELLVEEQEAEADDPFDAEVRKRLEAACDGYLERLAARPGTDTLIARGRRLRSRIAERGFSPAPRLVILAVI
jgi:SAM-dependent methyltransferase